MRQSKALVSTVIVLAIGLHAVPLLYPKERKTLWPFLVWAMYKNSHPPGPIQAHLRRMIGVTAKGETEEVTANVVGLAPPAIERKFTRPMLLGNFSGARELIDRLNLKRQDPFVELRVEGETYTVTDTGIVKESSPVITYRVDSSDSGPHP